MQSVFSTTDNSGEFSDFEIEVDQDKVMWGKMKGSNSTEDDAWITEVSFISSKESSDEEAAKIDAQTQASSKMPKKSKAVMNVPCSGIDLNSNAHTDVITNRPATADTPNELEKCTTISFNDWIIRIGKKDTSDDQEVLGNEFSLVEKTVPTNKDASKSKERTVTSDRNISSTCSMTTRLRVKMRNSGKAECLIHNNTQLQNELPNLLEESSRVIRSAEISERNYYKPHLNANMKASCTTHIRLQKTNNRLRRLPFLQPSFPLNETISKQYNTIQVKHENICSPNSKGNRNCDDEVANSRLLNNLSVTNNCLRPDLPKDSQSNNTVIEDEDTSLPLNSISSTTVMNPQNHSDTCPNSIKKRRKGNLWKRGKLPKACKNWPQKYKASSPSTDNSQCSSISSETSNVVKSSPTHYMVSEKFYSATNTVSDHNKLEGIYSFERITSSTTLGTQNELEEVPVLCALESVKPDMNSSLNKASQSHKASNTIKPEITKRRGRPQRQLKPSLINSLNVSNSAKNCKSFAENVSKRKKPNTMWNYLMDARTGQVAKKAKLSLNSAATPSNTTPLQKSKKKSASKKQKVVKKNPLVPKVMLKKCEKPTIKKGKAVQKNEKSSKKKKSQATQKKTLPSKEKLSNLAAQKKKAIKMQLKMNKKRNQQAVNAAKVKMALKNTKELVSHKKKRAKSKSGVVLKPSNNKSTTKTQQTTQEQNLSSQKALAANGTTLKGGMKSQNSETNVPQCSSKSGQTSYVSQSQLQLQHLASTFPLSVSSQAYLCPTQPQSVSTSALPTKKTTTKNRSDTVQPPHSSGSGRVGRPPKNVSSSIHSARIIVEHALSGSSINKIVPGSSCFASAATCLPRVVLPPLSWPENSAKRSSVRQTECAFRYREIIVKKMDDFIQIVLASNTRVKNGLNCQVMHELCTALTAAKTDPRCHLVVVHGTGSVFCSGVDLIALSTDKSQTTADKMSNAVRDFCKVLLSFPKPLVAAVNGAAVGLGVTFLPLFDLVYASDKATFYTPYCKLGQIPEGGATLTLPSIMGYAKANGLLLEGRRLTATEAHDSGLITQVLWPASFMEEVIPRVQALAKRPLQAMESTKALVRYHAHSKLEVTLDTECRILLHQWSSEECRAAIRDFLQFEEVV